MVRLVFCLWVAARGFTLFQRQATSKVSIDIFVRFPLASSAGRIVHTTGSLPPAATLRKIVVYQLAGWAGKWNAVPLALNNKALDPFSKDLSLSVGFLLVLAWLPVHIAQRT